MLPGARLSHSAGARELPPSALAIGVTAGRLDGAARGDAGLLRARRETQNPVFVSFVEPVYFLALR